MITALNTALIGVGRIPTCRICDLEVSLTACEVEKSKRARRPQHPVLRAEGDLIAVYSGGDAVSVACIRCNPTQYCGEQMTPVDGKFALTLQNGNVYAAIIDGRHDQTLDIMCDITLEDGSLIKAHRVAVLYRRPVVSDCLEAIRTPRTT